MKSRRMLRVNSLLKEVLSDVIHKQVKNPHVAEFVSVTGVDVSNDLHQAKVYVSIMGTQEEKDDTIKALTTASGFIAVQASKLVVLRHFPALTFYLDNSIDEHMKIERILGEIHEEQQKRGVQEDDEGASSSQ